MENIFGLTTCVAIVVIAYLIGIIIKNTDAIDDKWIPAICGIVGAPLGVLALHIVPDFPATDYLTAVAVGIVSGLAATGINQVFKQLHKDE
nr:MAG TPA: holin [Caudoviricetes sp.]